MDTAKIISLDISLGSYQDILQDIITLAKSRKPSYVCFANVHMTVEAAVSDEVKKGISGADIITADGMPIAKAIKYKYGIHQDRVAGMDVMPDILAMASTENLSVFLYGTTDEMLDIIKNKIKTDFPKLQIAGAISPPFGQNIRDISKTHVEEINSSGANIVMVALGCPKQEMWMAEHSANTNAVLLGLGGALPVYAGNLKRAPMWMQKSSLEWLYRLVNEPGRLFSRYFKTNSYFLFRIFFEIISYKLRK